MNIINGIKNLFSELRRKRCKERELATWSYNNQKVQFDLGEIVYNAFLKSGAKFRDDNDNLISWRDFVGATEFTYRVDEHLTFTLKRFYMNYMDKLWFGKEFKEDFYTQVTYYIDGFTVPWGNDYVALTKKALSKINEEASDYLNREKTGIRNYMESIRDLQEEL